MQIEIQVEIKSSAKDDETEVTLKEDVTPITSLTDVIETIIQEATDTHINVNPEQSKEVGFWSLGEDDGVPSPHESNL